MLSFSTFVDEKCDVINYPNANNEPKNQCPVFLYKENKEINNKYDDSVVKTLKHFIFTELFLQCLIFIDYFIRMFCVEKSLVELKYRIVKLRNHDTNNYIFRKIFIIIYRCIINFRSLYYILSITFIIFGLNIHPFFNCITLLEFVNRIQLMQTVLKAMYNIRIFVSLFAVSFFTTHFPNSTDTKNFLKTFMRMIDQTFKQDGGIGTYLDKSLDKNFIPYSIGSYFNIRFFLIYYFFY